MGVLQRRWHLVTERARLIKMPGALFLASTLRQAGLLRNQRKEPYRQAGLQKISPRTAAVVAP